MIHTTNLTVSSGMVHSPVPGQPVEASQSLPPVGRPAARKSQIIEEEEDDGFEDEIEEVDEFDGPGEEVEEDDGQTGHDETQTLRESNRSMKEAETAEATEPSTPASTHKNALEPAAELESSPLRPPRSSSLNSPPPETAAAVAAVLANKTANDEAEAPTSQSAEANATIDAAPAKPVTTD
jgi:hypothetical protein